MGFDSPLRYLGSKASLVTLLARILELNELCQCSRFELVTGRTGAVLQLVQKGSVAKIHLSGLDPCIMALGQSVLDEPERWVDAIHSVPLSLVEWRKQRTVYWRADVDDPFGLGFSAFCLNRCNRSGVVRGAAPMEARRAWTLVSTAKALPCTFGPRQKDANESALTRTPNGFVLNAFPADLGGNAFLRTRGRLDYVRDVYANCAISHFSLPYSLQRRRKTRELLIAPRKAF